MRHDRGVAGLVRHLDRSESPLLEGEIVSLPIRRKQL